MKVNFYADDRKMTVLSPSELVDFRDEGEARRFLNMFAQEPANLETLRRVLGEQYNAFMVAGLSDSEVLDHVARLVARTCLGWVRVELREIVPPSVAEGNAAQDDLEMEGDPLTEQEAEYEEVKPDPILPPLFPIIAKLECEALDLQRKIYNITLDLLRYAGWPWPDLSEVADKLQSVANSTQVALEEGSQGFANQLLGLADPANLLNKATQLGEKLVKTAVKTGEDLETLAGRTSEGLLKLLQNDAEAPAPSRVIPAFMKVVENQSEQVTKITKVATEGLSKLAEGEFEPADPSQMAELLQGFAVEQGKGVAAAAGRAAELVKQKLSKGMDQKESLPSLDGSLLLEAMTATIGDTSQGIISSVGHAVDVLAPLGALPKPVVDAAAAAQAAGDAVAGALGDA
ncbi:MAG: hypothetical protein KC613_26135, partial [Myxococcales bacterium]|nr:hypothetical protein [Myxococcales bacterium]